MTFETKVLDLSGGPVNLVADPDIAAMIAAAPAGGARIFMQNISPRAKTYYAELTDAPARTDKGHCLMVGDGFALYFAPGVPPAAWVWASSTGVVAVSPADG